MGCNCGKKKKTPIALREVVASAAPAKPVPTRPATWNGNPKETAT